MQVTFYIGRYRNGVGLLAALRGLDKVVNAWAVMEAGTMRRAFTQGGHASHGGSQWVALSPKYAKVKAAAGKANILVWSGLLRNSINSQVSRLSDTRWLVQIGTNVHYAKFHQYGAGGVAPNGVTRSVSIAASRRTISRLFGRRLRSFGKFKAVMQKGQKTITLAIPAFTRSVGNLPVRKPIEVTARDMQGLRGNIVTHLAKTLGRGR